MASAQPPTGDVATPLRDDLWQRETPVNDGPPMRAKRLGLAETTRTDRRWGEGASERQFENGAQVTVVAEVGYALLTPLTTAVPPRRSGQGEALRDGAVREKARVGSPPGT